MICQMVFNDRLGHDRVHEIVDAVPIPKVARVGAKLVGAQREQCRKNMKRAAPDQGRSLPAIERAAPAVFL